MVHQQRQIDSVLVDAFRRLVSSLVVPFIPQAWPLPIAPWPPSLHPTPETTTQPLERSLCSVPEIEPCERECPGGRCSRGDRGQSGITVPRKSSSRNSSPCASAIIYAVLVREWRRYGITATRPGSSQRAKFINVEKMT